MRATGSSGPEVPDAAGATVGDTAADYAPVGHGSIGSGPNPSSHHGCRGGGPSLPPAPQAPGNSRHRMGRSLLIGSVIGVGVAVLLVVALGSKPATGSAGPAVPIGSQAPDFSLPPLTGSLPVDLDSLGEHLHRPVILNFFASWCDPCQKETPLLAKAAVAEQANGGAVQFVGVDVNDRPTDALPFVRMAGITYPVGADQTFHVTSDLYGLDGLPQTFFISSDGKVLGHTIGAIDAVDLQAWMKKLDRGAPAEK
jgi:cytochrome c biogenesis protein CcmG/thiol:disulfide interchange protein DsbE